MSEVASAYVSLIPSFRGGTAAINRELAPLGRSGTQTGDEMGQGMTRGIRGRLKGLNLKGLIGSGLAVAGVASLAGALGDAAKEASELQTLQAQTNAVLKSTGNVAGIGAQGISDLSNEIEGYST